MIGGVSRDFCPNLQSGVVPTHSRDRLSAAGPSFTIAAMRDVAALLGVFLSLWCDGPLRAQDSQRPNGVERGVAKFSVRGDQKNIPERYRLEEHQFDWE